MVAQPAGGPPESHCVPALSKPASLPEIAGHGRWIIYASLQAQALGKVRVHRASGEV
ncbi:hypothetical protein PGTUg99_029852 [Puccinia graminis f. sp. tritici]|uniref:Uncharacterized protein n=1 Tax=Puccinia graminis f. sp. tritici TaxID=56615 RepID=A0A5B0N2B8_PUCGR|nr:hypothetical protein PGTUg99_029852 [Puccinia graminis f. sp. tritici]